jgi:hypothetical protein
MNATTTGVVLAGGMAVMCYASKPSEESFRVFLRKWAAAQAAKRGAPGFLARLGADLMQAVGAFDFQIKDWVVCRVAELRTIDGKLIARFLGILGEWRELTFDPQSLQHIQ